MALVLDVIGNSGKTWFGQIPSLLIDSMIWYEIIACTSEKQ